MRKINSSFILVFVILASLQLSCRLPFSLFNFELDQESSETESWQAEVDAIKQMTRSQPIPNFLTDPELPQEGALFDPNQLLSPLDHLSLESGYTLDFVYRYDGIGGKPFLYARELTDPPFKDLAEYAQANPNEFAYLDHIQSDGTEASYFQWVLLSLMGDQFYLYWHAGYNDLEIIASRERLEELVQVMTDTEFGIAFTKAQQRQALKIDPAPRVEVGQETVTVRVVSFSMWGGFTESVFTLSRSAPHRVLDVETVTLMEYDCGIMF